MSQTTTTPRTEPTTAPTTEPHAGGGRALKRHIVELDAEGQPLDQCLCGHIWDRVFLAHSDEICQECVDIARERGRGGR